MKRGILAIAIGAGVLLTGIGSQAPVAIAEEAIATRAPVAVTFIANEGFLLSDGKSKVMVDALFADHDYYDVPSEEVLRRMMGAEPPFDDVDLVLATHHHADHFDAATVASFLAAHPETVFFSTPTAVAEIEKLGEPFVPIAERVRTIDLGYGEGAWVSIRGIRLHVFNSGHSGDLKEFRNYMYAFDVGGQTVFHEGDSGDDPEIFLALGAAIDDVEIAFLHSWFLTGDRGLKIVEEQLEAERAVLMHVPTRFHQETLERLERIRARFPETTYFEASLDGRDFE